MRISRELVFHRPCSREARVYCHRRSLSWLLFSALCALTIGFQTAVGNIQTLPSDFYGSAVGQLAGFAGTAAKLAVVLLNFLIPVITVNSYAPAFAVGAGLAIMTVLSVLILCPRIEPLSGNK